jgi:hypothetical protein
MGVSQKVVEVGMIARASKKRQKGTATTDYTTILFKLTFVSDFQRTILEEKLRDAVGHELKKEPI